LQKLDDSLAKEPISTHAKHAIWKLDTKNKKADLQTIGKNKLTFSVVSSIITANENDNLEYPASTLAAPIIAYVDG
jgi:hypothetical protein